MYLVIRVEERSSQFWPFAHSCLQWKYCCGCCCWAMNSDVLREFFFPPENYPGGFYRLWPNEFDQKWILWYILVFSTSVPVFYKTEKRIATSEILDTVKSSSILHIHRVSLNQDITLVVIEAAAKGATYQSQQGCKYFVTFSGRCLIWSLLPHRRHPLYFYQERLHATWYI